MFFFAEPRKRELYPRFHTNSCGSCSSCLSMALDLSPHRRWRRSWQLSAAAADRRISVQPTAGGCRGRRESGPQLCSGTSGPSGVPIRPKNRPRNSKRPIKKCVEQNTMWSGRRKKRPTSEFVTFPSKEPRRLAPFVVLYFLM